MAGSVGVDAHWKSQVLTGDERQSCRGRSTGVQGADCGEYGDTQPPTDIGMAFAVTSERRRAYAVSSICSQHRPSASLTIKLTLSKCFESVQAGTCWEAIGTGVRSPNAPACAASRRFAACGPGLTKPAQRRRIIIWRYSRVPACALDKRAVWLTGTRCYFRCSHTRSVLVSGMTTKLEELRREPRKLAVVKTKMAIAVAIKAPH